MIPAGLATLACQVSPNLGHSQQHDNLQRSRATHLKLVAHLPTAYISLPQGLRGLAVQPHLRSLSSTAAHTAFSSAPGEASLDPATKRRSAYLATMNCSCSTGLACMFST